MANLTVDSMAASPACLPVEAHEACMVATEIARPQVVDNAAERQDMRIHCSQFEPEVEGLGSGQPGKCSCMPGWVERSSLVHNGHC